MIILFANRGYCHTHNALKRQRDFSFRVWPYARLFRARRLPPATYIFTDLDRLHWWDLEMAGRRARDLREAGMRVLNDPARVSHRHHLLTSLYDAGINDFTAWYAGERPPAAAYPVFLRTESAHRGALTGLLHTPAALENAEREALDAGVPRRELMIVQYRAEPIADGLYRKLAVYRVGDTLVSALCAHEDQWMAKNGVQGIAGPQWYEDEYALVTGKSYPETLRAAFRVASIDYGRADYGLVAGHPAIYEINTNPMLKPLTHHSYPIRLESYAVFERNLIAAFSAIDGPATGRSVRPTDPRTLRMWLRDLWRQRQWRRVPSMP
jgi:hypothetical protein